uniref:ShKT domain-containing protein n=1 Tax=Trichuris muris TaxID=70415 RepID=A0A5S6QNX5_TRIMR
MLARLLSSKLQIQLLTFVLCISCLAEGQQGQTLAKRLFQELLCRFCCSSVGNLCLGGDTNVPCSECPCCLPGHIGTVKMDLTKPHSIPVHPFGANSRPRMICQCPHSDDNDRKCSFWAHLGECERIPGFMFTMCPVSCGICC